jgi:hypothetical protein
MGKCMLQMGQNMFNHFLEIRKLSEMVIQQHKIATLCREEVFYPNVKAPNAIIQKNSASLWTLYL